MTPNERHEIRLAGSGGQGVILATIILAEAAILSGKHAAQSGAYGPEARGGSCKAETLISDTTIGFTKVQNPTLLMAFTQKALDQYALNVSKECLVVIDASLIAPKNVDASKLVSLPMITTAKNVVGKIQTANIVGVGVVNALLHIADHDVLRTAVSKRVPKGTDALNLKALEEGYQLVLAWKKEHGA